MPNVIYKKENAKSYKNAKAKTAKLKKKKKLAMVSRYSVLQKLEQQKLRLNNLTNRVSIITNPIWDIRNQVSPDSSQL